MLYMLDTDIASSILKSRCAAARERLTRLAPGDVSISVMTRAELLFGLRALPPQHPLRLLVNGFLQQIRSVPWDDAAAGHYADIKQQLRSEGQPIGEFDTMIAAHSLALGVALVTNKLRHYERIAAPLLLLNWA